MKDINNNMLHYHSFFTYAKKILMSNFHTNKWFISNSTYWYTLIVSVNKKKKDIMYLKKYITQYIFIYNESIQLSKYLELSFFVNFIQTFMFMISDNTFYIDEHHIVHLL